MPYIILDRDGVINFDSDEYIKSPAEWTAIPGSLTAIAKLNRAGFKVLVATNQSGIARGYYDENTLQAIHDKLIIELNKVKGEIEEIYYCPHHPNDQCECRKPNIGLIQAIEKNHPINLTETFFIGDSYTDMQAAQQAGCKPLLVLTGNGEKTLLDHPELNHIPHFIDLAQAVDYVVSHAAYN